MEAENPGDRKDDHRNTNLRPKHRWSQRDRGRPEDAINHDTSSAPAQRFPLAFRTLHLTRVKGKFGAAQRVSFKGKTFEPMYGHLLLRSFADGAGVRARVPGSAAHRQCIVHPVWMGLLDTFNSDGLTKA